MSQLWIKQQQNGQIIGPLPVNVLGDLVASGRVRPDDWVANEQSGPWRKVLSLEGGRYSKRVFTLDDSSQNNDRKAGAKSPSPAAAPTSSPATSHSSKSFFWWGLTTFIGFAFFIVLIQSISNITTPPNSPVQVPLEWESHIDYQKGNLLFERADWKSSVLCYSRVLTRYPDAAVVLSKRGQAYERLGKLQNAISDYSQAISLEPENSFFLLLRGRTAIEQENWESGLKYLLLAKDLNPSLEGLNDVLIATYLGRAEDLAKHPVNTSPTLMDLQNAEADLQKARKLGASQNGLAKVEKLLGLNYLKLAAEWAKSNKFQNALEICNRLEQSGVLLEQIKPIRSDAMVTLAIYQERKGQLESAIQNLEIAVKLNPSVERVPERYRILIELGTQSLDSGRYEAAVQYFGLAVSLESTGETSQWPKLKLRLMEARRSLATQYIEEAEDALAAENIMGIRNACDAAEKYDAALVELNRLRAEAFRFEGKQKLNSGDAAGAIVAYEKALKLNGRLELRTERSLAHVKLGEQSVEKKDYSNAISELNAAVSLDKFVSVKSGLAVSVAEFAVVTFEQESSDVNQAMAISSLETLESPDFQSSQLSGLQQRVAAVLIKRGELAVGSDMDSALTSYESAVSLGASADRVGTLKEQIIRALTIRLQESLENEDWEKVSSDFTRLQQMNSQAASKLVKEFENVPLDIRAKLPVEILSQLSPNLLSELPVRQNSLGMKFKWLPSGTFTMGDAEGDSDDRRHRVTLTKSFELGVYEVTQEQYQKVMGKNLSSFKGTRIPVDMVSWHDAVEFSIRLSNLPEEKAAGYVYRLPTEAEWEYACRAGTDTAYSFGDSDAQLGDYAWYGENSSSTSHPVGQKKPNPWGLYDMHGNVYEWCQDWYVNYPEGAVTDPTGPSSGSDRVFRGGSWLENSEDCRSAGRHGRPTDHPYISLGFRVLRSSVSEDDNVSQLRTRGSFSDPDGTVTNSVPSAYRLRSDQLREKAILKYGGTDASEKSVDLSLNWLASVQKPDGSWDASEYKSGQVGIDRDGIDRKYAGRDADTGVTALAVLAFLGKMNTIEKGIYSPNVKKALRWLVAKQKTMIWPNGDQSSGYLGGNATQFAGIYCHGMATFAIAEAYAVSKDSKEAQFLRQPLEQALKFIFVTQNDDGGWRYVKGQPDGDMSIFGWQLMAMKSAEAGGISIPIETKYRMTKFLDDRRMGLYGGLAGYREGEPPTAPMTAEAMFSRQVLGLDTNKTAAVDEASRFLLSNRPSRRTLNLYYWYYGTLAMFQRGGKDWEEWNAAMRDLMISEQRTVGPLAGSWDPRGVWGSYGGRIYSTAIATLSLEVYYRYLREDNEDRTQ